MKRRRTTDHYWVWLAAFGPLLLFWLVATHGG